MSNNTSWEATGIQFSYNGLTHSDSMGRWNQCDLDKRPECIKCSIVRRQIYELHIIGFLWMDAGLSPNSFVSGPILNHRDAPALIYGNIKWLVQVTFLAGNGLMSKI